MTTKLVERFKWYQCYYGDADADKSTEFVRASDYERLAADLARFLRNIAHCKDCGASWYDDGNNGVSCPYCQIARHQNRMDR